MFTTHTFSNDNDRQVVQLFNSVMKNFIAESILFYKEWGEYPFIYRERQVNSALIPAIHKYTKNIFLELPFKNKFKEQRFLDIVTTKGKSIFLIELKHSYNSKLENTTTRTDNEWETAVDQIADITKTTMKNHYDYKVALMIMPTYLPSNDKNKILEMTSKEYAKILFDDYQIYNKKYTANIVVTAKINNYSKYVHKYTNAEEVYPFISFIGKVGKV